MSYKVKVREQVWQFAHALGLEHRRALKRAIISLAAESGDITPLHDDMAGFYRLKVARFRVIFLYRPGRVIECVFAEERKLVYELFEAEMARILGQK